MKQTKRQIPLMTTVRARRFLILSIASWIIMGMLLITVVIPRFQVAMTLRTENETSKVALEKLQNKAEFLDSFKTNEFEAQNAAVQRILPSSKPFLQMLSSLEQLAGEQGVTFAGLDVSPGVIASASGESAPASKDAKNGIASLDLKLTVYGSSLQISNFMDKVTNVAPALDVKTFSSTSQPGGATLATDPTAAIYKADINLASLYAPVSVTVGIKQSLPTLTKEENEYARTKIPLYVIFPQQSSAPLSTDGLGKPDPFSF